jgi:hypothetical protein
MAVEDLEKLIAESHGGALVALTPVAADPHDATVDELVEVYRAIAGEHPDWDEYRATMVADRRLVVRLTVERVYGSGGR